MGSVLILNRGKGSYPRRRHWGVKTQGECLGGGGPNFFSGPKLRLS